MLQYWGSKSEDVRIHAGSAFSWVDAIEKIVDKDGAACRKMVERLEKRVNAFGYSLKDWLAFEEPPLFKGHLLHPYDPPRPLKPA